MSESDERFVDRRAAARMGGSDSNEKPGQPTNESVEPQQAEPAREAAEGGDDWQAKAEQYYANWQRAAADHANYRRRTEEEKREWSRLANAALVINVLPVFDDLERAVGTVDAKLAGLNWVQGVEAIYRKFSHLLDSMGVTPVETEDASFNPEEHEAVGEQPGPEGKVLYVAQKGYKLGEKVIRPAMVIVGNGEQPPGGGTDAKA
jgi:molecular chaperone GrpE